MIREKRTKKEVSGNRAFVVVILLSIGIIFLSSLVGYLQNQFGIMHLEKIIYVIVIVVAYFLIKNYLTEYRYSFFDNELIIEKILGKRTTQIATIKSRQIAFFGKLSEIEWDNKDMHIDHCDVSKKEAYVIKYVQHEMTKLLTLNPSEDLVMHIQKSVEAKDFDEVDEEKLIK